MSKLVYDGWHKIEEIEVEMKGDLVKRELLHLKSAVAGIVTDKLNRIALVSQYRPTLQRNTLEIPAGVIDKNLSPENILIEELYEECNLFKHEIIHIEQTVPSGYHMVSGSSPAYLYLYRVKVNTSTDKKYEVLDSDVDYVEWVTFEEFEQLVLGGKVMDSKTLFAYFILKGEQ